MPVLANPRHEKFAQEVAKGASATEAYKLAGYDCEGSSGWSSASRLFRSDKVASRVRELTSAAADKAVLTKAWVIERLMLNAERALQQEAVRNGDGEETGEFKYEGQVANRALELLGKEIGMFVDRSEVTNVNYDVSDAPISADEWAAQHATSH